ncbi:MAG TPA: L,D-transpeptidase family protein [Bacteroidia bacterium]
MDLRKNNFLFLALLSIIGISYPVKFFLKNNFNLFQQQDTVLYNRQYYLLQKALTDSANAKRTEQIRINMERWKAFPKNPGRQYLFVNVADFSLQVVENDSVVMGMKAIVGRTYRKTPVFNAKLSHIVFNPSWNIPISILKKDILPVVFKDTSYLRKKHIRIYRYGAGGIREVVPADSVNWHRLSIHYFPYELIQDPGKDNSLGVVLFMFPNPYDVFMHDTPAKNLFNKSEPAFSSGCIRISDAIGLADYLLKNKRGWDRKKIMEVIQSGKTTTVNLAEPIDIYITYFTAWMDEHATLQFRKDIYDQDTLQLE